MTRFLLLVQDFARRGSFAGGGAVAFALVTASMFGIALAPAPDVLRAAAPAVLWVMILLAALLSLETAWHRPLHNGRFDALLFSGFGAVGVAGAAVGAHWLTSGLPAVLAAVMLAPMLGLPVAVLPVLVASLLMGTLYLSLMGAAGALLTYGARGPGLVMAVVVLPLMLPMLLLGLMAVARWMLVPDGINPYLLLQAALLLLAAPALLAGAGWLLRTQFSR